LRLSLLLVGTEAAFDTVETVTRERMAKVMNEMEVPKPPEAFITPPDEDVG